MDPNILFSYDGANGHKADDLESNISLVDNYEYDSQNGAASPTINGDDDDDEDYKYDSDLDNEEIEELYDDDDDEDAEGQMVIIIIIMKMMDLIPIYLNMLVLIVVSIALQVLSSVILVTNGFVIPKTTLQVPILLPI